MYIGSSVRATTGLTPSWYYFSRSFLSCLWTSNKLGPDDEEDEVEDALSGAAAVATGRYPPGAPLTRRGKQKVISASSSSLG